MGRRRLHDGRILSEAGDIRGWLPRTRLAGIGRRGALGILAATAAVAVVLMLVALFAPASPTGAGAADADGGDIAMYARLVERLHAGEPYYDAARAELLAGNYGTRSVLNWRTPAYFGFLGLLPSLVWAQVTLAVLGLGAAALSFVLFRREGGLPFALLLVPFLVLGLASVMVPPAVLLPEVPAGMLILLSAAAFALGRPGVGVAAGGAALFIRELAAPYALISAWLAWRDGRRREVVAWLVIFAAYAAYFGWHAMMVAGALGPEHRAYPDGWLQWGGPAFALATAAFNGAWTVMPLWVTALMLPVALLGLAAWRGAGSQRVAATVVTYLLLFAAFGKPFNYYWGAIYTPLLALGLPWAIAAGRDLRDGLRR